MKQLICEMCGGNDLIKQDGVFVCQNCGTKYTVEEAKKMMKEVVEKVESATDAVKEATDFFKEHIDGLKEKNNELFTLFPTKGIEESQYYVLEHLRDTDYVADDIFDDFTFDETQNAFTSVAVFGGPITYHWTASSGFDREEKYTEYVEKTEVLKNGEIRTYKEPVTKTRIVTDWRPSSGTVSDYYTNHFVVDPNNFSKKDGFFRNHISSNADFKQENSISLWQVYKDQENGEQIYNELKNSIPKIKKMMIEVAERSSGSYNIPGDHVKDLHDSADFRLETFKLILYPIVKGKYKYKQQSYDFAVDAIDGNSKNLTVDNPLQSDTREKHNLVITKAEKQKQEKIAKKINVRKTVIGTGWGLAIVPMVQLFLKWLNNGEPSIIFPILILLAAVIWHFSFNSKFKKDIANINYEENRKIEQIKRFIQNENKYKKYLRQESFLKFINNLGNEKFIAMAKDFEPKKIQSDGKVDEALSDLDEYEKQETLKQESKKLTFPESCKVLWAFFIIFVFIGGGLFIATIANIISPNDTKLYLGLAGAIMFFAAWLFFWLGNTKIKKLRDSRGFDSKRNKTGKIIGVICMICAIAVGGYSFATPTIRAAQTYSKAEALASNGDYVAAIELFEELGDQEKVNEYIPLAVEQQVAESKEVCRQTQIGSVITIGNYEAVVLNKESDRILIMLLRYSGNDPSRNLNTVYEKIYDYKSSSWENSSLRSFLNGEFLDEFPKSIHRLIMEVDLPNIAQSGEDYGTTKDKVFLLSAVSDKHYIDAIIENGMIINSTTFTRTPASNTTVVSIDVENYFDGTGNHYAIGEQEVSNSYYIRPCMWIDIS